jgi:hypothetical protein
MKSKENLLLDVRPTPNLETAIENWLTARAEYKTQPSDESEYNYNATYFALGAAWAERYPEAADTPGAFEWFRRGLIAPEED